MPSILCFDQGKTKEHESQRVLGVVIIYPDMQPSTKHDHWYILIFLCASCTVPFSGSAAPPSQLWLRLIPGTIALRLDDSAEEGACFVLMSKLINTHQCNLQSTIGKCSCLAVKECLYILLQSIGMVHEDRKITEDKAACRPMQTDAWPTHGVFTQGM